MPLRQANEKIAREAELAEKVIEARLSGVQVSPNAQQELRDLVARLLNALDESDLQTFRACFPHGADKGIDAKDLHEFRTNTLQLAPGLRAVVADRAVFQIEDDGLGARIELPGDWVFEAVYEADGWKIANVRRDAPREGVER
jgi:hypothetical protein